MQSFKEFAVSKLQFSVDNYFQNKMEISILATCTNGLLEELGETLEACQELYKQERLRNMNLTNNMTEARQKLKLEIGDCLAYLGIVSELLGFTDYSIFAKSNEDEDKFYKLWETSNTEKVIEAMTTQSVKLICDGLGIHKRLFRGDVKPGSLETLYAAIYSMMCVYMEYGAFGLNEVIISNDAKLTKRKDDKKLLGTGSER